MIVDLHLRDRFVLVVGGGGQALKKTKDLLQEGCSILVISKDVVPEIEDLATEGHIRLQRAALADAGALKKHRPFLVISATSNTKLNQEITAAAGEMGILAFSSDCPQQSSFASVSTIAAGGPVRVAVSTGGRSPIMARKIREEIESAVRDAVTEERLNQIRVQETAREMAGAIGTQRQRRRFLYAVMDDPAIDRLIKAGDLTEVRGRIRDLLENWR